MYKHGDMDGLGTRTFANGSAYEGAFIDGAMHGEGMMHWANKNQYVGIWKDNMPHGRGVIMQAPSDHAQHFNNGGDNHGQ
jgi:hypothetical protein|mmetsp:Transcript_11414/g.37371  ORF Transcript_11414/g.37371 Transcript_11414/m.37371 type:complete len:80 (-) Transcript_11414:1186-1425(-)